MIPNQFPTQPPTDIRVAIIGECVSREDILYGQPFSGMAGRLLDGLLSNAGINRSTCFVGNVCPVQLPGGDINKCKWFGDEIQAGITQLRSDLERYNPTFIILLGSGALRAFHPLGGSSKISVSDWRGSLFMSTFLGHPIKCLATHHPAMVLRTYGELIGVVKFDLRRASQERHTGAITERKLDIAIDLSFEALLERLRQLRATPCTVAFDLEGRCSTGVTCIGFATSSTSCFVVPFERTDGSSVWSEEQEIALWEAVRDVLEDDTVIKIAHNGLYEKFVLGWVYGISVVRMDEDSMVKHFELYPEMEKSLAFCASIYTTQPFYKGDRTSLDDRVAFTYNGLDCVTTFEVSDALDKLLTPAQVGHYRFNISCLNPLTYMSLRGIRYDRDAALAQAATIQHQVYELQHQLNQEAGICINYTEESEFIERVALACCRKNPKRKIITIVEGKRGPREKEVSVPVNIRTWEEVEEFCNDSQRANYGRLFGLRSKLGESAARGEASCLLGLHLNIDSSDQLAEFLYTKKGLPKQFIKEKGKLTDRLTTAAPALLRIYVKTKDPLLKLILKIRSLMTQYETLIKPCDPDGRIRCGYNLVGADTSRLSCYESPAGSGFNLQTVTKDHRFLFGSDPGCDMAQCDLKGADGWTVAVRAFMEGDPTMLDDLRFGIKPANVVALMHQQGPAVNRLTRPELKDMAKQVDGDGWLYLTCKKTQHGSCYLMGKNTMSDGILEDSYAETGEPVYVAPKVCENIQQMCFFVRYPGIQRWHERTRQVLKSHGFLVMGNTGHRRDFFGRKDDHGTLAQALAQEPQFNTTLATKKALYRLWLDPDNRHEDGSLKQEPLHTVHDSLITQFATELKEWAKAKLKEWFNNEILVGHIPIVIPFAGTVGKNWLMKDVETI